MKAPQPTEQIRDPRTREHGQKVQTPEGVGDHLGPALKHH